jgi:23S rRNA (cytosine1962-C5)-methyltransferase
MHKIRVSKTLQKKIRQGHPWVFHYQIENSVEASSGDLGVIYDSQNRFLAIGLLDPDSDLRLRILQVNKPIRIDAEFFRSRLQKAIALRRGLAEQGTTGYRLVNGESDGFPGIILDRYGDVLVMKLYTLSWLPFLKELVEVLQEELSVTTCVLRWSRNIVTSRLESTQYVEGSVLFGDKPTGPVRFCENHLTFEADIYVGHKTGFFLDQRDNRHRVGEMVKDQRVLNVFSYTGGFSVYAFAGGATSVCEVDVSSQALELSRRNIQLNFPDRKFSGSIFRQIQGDVFDALPRLIDKGERFDRILLDPPSFAGNKKQIQSALRAYSGLAEMGAKLTRPGGIIFAASCSRQVKEEQFFSAVMEGVQRADLRVKEICRTGHADDHPVCFPEGQYLKAIYLHALAL